MKKVVTLEELLPLRQQLQAQAKTLVFTNGCFDLLHIGHLRYLRQAKALGDILVIGLNSDASTRTIKGPQRPILPEQERAETLAALELVDYVVIFPQPTAENLVTALKPEIYVKGADYTEEELPEAKVVADYGGKVVILPLVEGRSTTEIIRTIVERYGRG